MNPEPSLGQREIVGLRMAFEDVELDTKYTLPFVDASWHVPFVVLDLLGHPPRILEAEVHADGRRLQTPASTRALRPIESVPREDFADLVHFDPWWAFRGVSGVERPWIESIFRTNVARPFHHEGRTYKIHDLKFAPGMRKLDALIAKDEVFHPREFLPGDIDLLGLRAKPAGGPAREAPPTSKSL
jgi:hypothetical protein